MSGFYTMWQFWTGVSAIVAPSLIAITARYGNRRRLVYISSDAPGTRLLQTPQEFDNVQITHDGVLIKDPHILHLTVYNAGPTDITTEDFDGGRATAISIGATIRQVIDTAGRTPLRQVPRETSGDRQKYGPGTLFITPDLIGRHKGLHLILITSGPASVTLAHQAIRNTNTRLRSDYALISARFRFGLLATAALLALATIMLVYVATNSLTSAFVSGYAALAALAPPMTLIPRYTNRIRHSEKRTIAAN